MPPMMSALADVVITDEDVDQIEAVGDLIRHIKTWIVRGDDAPSSRRRSSDPPVQNSWQRFELAI